MARVSGMKLVQLAGDEPHDEETVNNVETEASKTTIYSSEHPTPDATDGSLCLPPLDGPRREPDKDGRPHDLITAPPPWFLLRRPPF